MKSKNLVLLSVSLMATAFVVACSKDAQTDNPDLQMVPQRSSESQVDPLWVIPKATALLKIAKELNLESNDSPYLKRTYFCGPFVKGDSSPSKSSKDLPGFEDIVTKSENSLLKSFPKENASLAKTWHDGLYRSGYGFEVSGSSMANVNVFSWRTPSDTLAPFAANYRLPRLLPAYAPLRNFEIYGRTMEVGNSPSNGSVEAKPTPSSIRSMAVVIGKGVALLSLGGSNRPGREAVSYCVHKESDAQWGRIQTSAVSEQVQKLMAVLKNQGTEVSVVNPIAIDYTLRSMSFLGNQFSRLSKTQQIMHIYLALDALASDSIGGYYIGSPNIQALARKFLKPTWVESAFVRVQNFIKNFPILKIFGPGGAYLSLATPLVPNSDDLLEYYLNGPHLEDYLVNHPGKLDWQLSHIPGLAEYLQTIAFHMESYSDEEIQFKFVKRFGLGD